MRAKLIGSIGVLLTAAGLALGDETRPDRLPPGDPPATGQKDTPTKSDGKLGEPKTEKKSEQILTMPVAPAPMADGCGTGPQHDAQLRERARIEALKDDHMGPDNKFWANVDFLWWWTKDGPLPVQLAVSGSGETIGAGDFSYGDGTGGRLTVGGWLDCMHHCGFEVSGFLLDRRNASSTLASDDNAIPTIFRPIISVTNVSVFEPTSYLVSGPFTSTTPDPNDPNDFTGTLSGSITVASRSRFWGAEANAIRNLIAEYGCQVDLLLGFRYLDLDENLHIDQTSTVQSGTIPFNGSIAAGVPGSILSLSDQFSTRNNLYLGQVGGRARWQGGPVSVDMLCKVGFGPNNEQVRINGSSTLTTPNAVSNAATGGLLALANTNIGHARTAWFSIVPEVGTQVGWNITDALNVHIGYSFLYLNSVVRPGDQINNKVNPAYLPTAPQFGLQSSPAEPSPLFRRTDYFVHGINAGVMLRY